MQTKSRLAREWAQKLENLKCLTIIVERKIIVGSEDCKQLHFKPGGENIQSQYHLPWITKIT